MKWILSAAALCALSGASTAHADVPRQVPAASLAPVQPARPRSRSVDETEVVHATASDVAGGIVLLVLGPTAIMGSAWFAWIVALNGGRSTGLFAGSIVTGSVGVGLTVAGAILLADTRGRPRRPANAAPASMTRVPTWSTAFEREPRPAMPFVVPIFATTF